MNPRDHSSFLKTLVEAADVAIGKANTKYYRSAWVKQNRLFNSLHRPKINAQLWRELMLVNRDNRMLKSFAPQEDGFARPVVYGRVATRTGRLTVKSGPQILTLNRQFRNVISAIGDDECVGMFDFNACEMRVLLYEAGFSCDEPDLYGMIKRVHLPKIERNVVKGAVIGRAYGLSKHVWGPNLGIKGKTLSHIDDTLNNLIDTSFLLRRVKEQFARDGYISNRYDRRIKVDVPMDHVLINTYAQSTGNDVTILGYASMLDKLEALGARALYTLHDALIVSFPAKHLEEMKKIQTVKVAGYVQRFYLRFELMSCSRNENADTRTD